MTRGQVEILFPLAEVSDTSAQGVFVDGLSNTLYGPGPTMGSVAPGALPHQIATDTIYTPGGSGGPSAVFDKAVAEAGNAQDSARAFLNLLYYEFTVKQLGGTFASPPGELQWGFALSGYSVDDPSFTLSDGDTGLPLGYDANSFGIFDALSGSGYAAFGETPVTGGTGITYQAGHTYGVAVDLVGHTAVYRDCTALLAGPASAYTTSPYGFTSTAYDLSGFGTAYQFHIGFSLAYKGSPNEISFNPGGAAFVLASPAGYSAWDGSGNTSLTMVGSGLTVSGRNVTAGDAALNGVIYGALSNTTYRLR
jgi:hypothetical protein